MVTFDRKQCTSSTLSVLVPSIPVAGGGGDSLGHMRDVHSQNLSYDSIPEFRGFFRPIPTVWMWFPTSVCTTIQRESC